MGLPWPGVPAAGLPTWNLTNSIQPACIIPEAQNYLITEAMRGEGAYLQRPDGSAVLCRILTNEPSWRHVISSPALSTLK